MPFFETQLLLMNLFFGQSRLVISSIPRLHLLYFLRLLQVARRPSSHTKFKLNTDRALSSNMGMADIGALILDQNRNLIMALASNIGLASNVSAELWAIRDGLIMVQQKNIMKIHIETDSCIVLQMLHRDSAMMQIHDEMVKDIRALIRQFKVVLTSFCTEKLIGCMADGSASLGKNSCF